MPDEISAEEKSCWFQELWKKQEEVVAQTSPAMIERLRECWYRAITKTNHALGVKQKEI